MMNEVIPVYAPAKKVNPYKVLSRVLWTVLLLAVTTAAVLTLTAAVGGAGEAYEIIGGILAIITAAGWLAYLSSVFTLLSDKAHAWEEKNNG